MAQVKRNSRCIPPIPIPSVAAAAKPQTKVTLAPVPHPPIATNIPAAPNRNRAGILFVRLAQPIPPKTWEAAKVAAIQAAVEPASPCPM